MLLIVGLGNPGKEYENTRHNSGFMAMDLLAAKCGADIRTEKWNALTATVRIEGQPVLLMKPLTFMNRSGSAVIQAVDFYKIAPEDVLIIHDDMDLPVGSLRIRKNGSSGGQNGLNNIILSVFCISNFCEKSILHSFKSLIFLKKVALDVRNFTVSIPSVFIIK